MPSFWACCRRAPSVRLICFAILATGVLAFECLRNSASKGLVQRARFATLFAISTLHWAVVTNQFAVAHCNVEQLVLPRRRHSCGKSLAASRRSCAASKSKKILGCDEWGFVTIRAIALNAAISGSIFAEPDAGLVTKMALPFGSTRASQISAFPHATARWTASSGPLLPATPSSS